MATNFDCSLPSSSQVLPTFASLSFLKLTDVNTEVNVEKHKKTTEDRISCKSIFGLSVEIFVAALFVTSYISINRKTDELYNMIQYVTLQQ